MAKHQDQAARRRNITLRDQHGREWDSTEDVIARGTCAPINPKNFSPPFETPQKYLKADTGERKVEVMFDQWIDDLEAAHKTYEQKLSDDAFMLFGESGLKMFEDRAPALLRFTGQPPQPVEVVKAAKAGNKFCLGLSDKMPEWAKPFFLKPEMEKQEFPDAEEYSDYEEQADPDAIGGKRVPVKNNKKLSEAA